METDLLTYVEKAVEKQADIRDRLFEWQILEEERLEAKLQSEIKKAKNKSLENFDKYFAESYVSNKSLNLATSFLLSIKLDPRVVYSQQGEFKFKRFTFPVKIKDWLMSKQTGNAPQSAINIVSEINPDPFANALDDSVFRGYGAGGQSVFHVFDIGIDFALRDENVEAWLRNYEIQLAQSVTQEISSKIKFELLEGIKNAESIPEIRDRVLSAWNKPIDVAVPPKIAPDGTVVRQGYQYTLKPEVWATTVARTEVSRAYAAGKLEGYEQTKVVEKVEWLITPDERLCPNCGAMDGEKFTLEQAQGLIPLHGNCRCTWIPILLPDKNFDDAKKEAKENVETLYKEPTKKETATTRTIKPEESKLSSDKLKTKSDLGGGVNETLITSDGVKGVFKPVDGERPFLRESIEAGTYYKKEVAAYRIDSIMGFDMVPPTIIRTVEGNVGSHQLFMKGYKCWDIADIAWKNAVSLESKRRMRLLDYILGSEDRHTMNFMVNNKGKMAAIDNGLSLGKYVDYNRNYWDDALHRIEITKKVAKGIDDIWNNFNWRKMELMKSEILDAGILEEDAFISLMGRIRAYVKDDIITANNIRSETLFYKDVFFATESRPPVFKDMWNDLKSVFREAGKL